MANVVLRVVNHTEKLNEGLIHVATQRNTETVLSERSRAGKASKIGVTSAL